MKTAMRLFNETPFQVKGHSGMLEPGQPFLTIVVKGTFALKDGAAAEALPPDEQPKLGPAVAFLDNDGNSLKTDNDMVPFKQRADCIFVGARGVRGLKRLLLGSVSSAVAMNAHCSVEIVHGDVPKAETPV